MPRTRERRCRRRSLGCSQDLETMAAGCYPVTRPGRYGRYVYTGSYPDMDTPQEEVDVAFPPMIRVCPTSTTEVEPLSHHGAPPRARRIAAAHVALPRASRHFSARETVVDHSFLNPVSHMHPSSDIRHRPLPEELLVLRRGVAAPSWVCCQKKKLGGKARP